MSGAVVDRARAESGGPVGWLRGGMLPILLAAAFLRLYGLVHLSPPGLEHDEVANWLIDQQILQGNHAVYFTDAYGHEAGFHYLQSAFISLLGDHALALRLPAAFAGLLLIAVSYALARRLFDPKVARFSAALLAVLFFPVFYSRLGLRAITLPLVSGFSAYFWWRGWANISAESGSRRRQPRADFLLAGLFAGLSLYTYMAARAVPIFYALFILYLTLFHRPALKRRWQHILLFCMIFAITAAPLTIFLQTNPGAEFRISEIDVPLRAMLTGDLGPVLANSLKILAMFGFSGDPLWRQNVAHLPLFDPVVAALFYLSLPIFLARFRDERYAFLILWLTTAVVPSIVTIDAPSSIRIINSLPVLALFPGVVIHNSGGLSTVINKLSTKIGDIRGQLGLTILILYYIGLTGWALFQQWPGSDEVQFVWQKGLTQAAGYLDSAALSGPVAVGGWTPETMDRPTMELSLSRNDLKLSYFDPTSSLLIPGAADGIPIRIVWPTILEMDPVFVSALSQWGASFEERGAFSLYTLPAAPDLSPAYSLEAQLGEQVTIIGIDILDWDDNSLDLVTVWQVDAVSDYPKRLFVRLLDGDGGLLAEHYALDRADSRYQPHWQPGDTILQRHTLSLDLEKMTEAAKPYSLRIGIYDANSCPPDPCRNLLTDYGEPFLLLPLDS